MGKITSLFVHKVVAAAGDGLDRTALLRSVGLEPEGAPEVAQMIPDTAYYGLLERIAAQAEDATDLPLRAGASMRCDDYGAFGLAWKAAPTLRASFARAERYSRLLTSVSEYEVRAHDAGAFFILHRQGPRRLGLRMSNEATLASVVSIVRQVTPTPFVPLEVLLKHPAPRSVTAHEAYFGCPVRFGAELDAISVSAEALARRNRLGDDGITRFLLRHLDAELDRLRADQPLERQVRNAIARTLSDGAPRMADIARRLGLSERTLHRRLSGDGLSFQKLTEDARRELAEGLLHQSDYSLAEIAFLTGFSEQSAFNRAFKRWANQTPAAFREARRSA